MEEEFKRDAVIHHLMAVCGGFIGVYAIVSRMGVFGSAQTANLIELVCDILGREPMEILSRVAALAIYMGAMVLYVVLEKRSPWDVRRVSILIDLGAVGLSGLIPEGGKSVRGPVPHLFCHLLPVVRVQGRWELCVCHYFLNQQFEADGYIGYRGPSQPER